MTKIDSSFLPSLPLLIFTPINLPLLLHSTMGIHHSSFRYKYAAAATSPHHVILFSVLFTILSPPLCFPFSNSVLFIYFFLLVDEPIFRIHSILFLSGSCWVATSANLFSLCWVLLSSFGRFTLFLLGTSIHDVLVIRESHRDF